MEGRKRGGGGRWREDRSRRLRGGGGGESGKGKELNKARKERDIGRTSIWLAGR